MSFKKDLKKLLKKYKNEFLSKDERQSFYELILSKYLTMKEKHELALAINPLPIIDSFGELNLEATGFKYDKKTDSYYMKSKDKWRKILENLDKKTFHDHVPPYKLDQRINEGEIKVSPVAASVVLEKEPTKEQFEKFKESFAKETTVGPGPMTDKN